MMNRVDEPSVLSRWSRRLISVVLSGTLAVTGLMSVGVPRAAAADESQQSTVTVWGDDSFSQGRVPQPAEPAVAIAVAETHSLALKRDGTVVAWGYGATTVPEGLGGVVGVAAGTYHNLALKNDGTVVGWGDDYYARIPEGLSGVVAIAAGHYHSLALKSDGTVVAWGYNGSGQTAVPEGLSGVVAIAAGNSHSLALKSDGTVVAWGENSSGEATVPAGLTEVTAIAAGWNHSLAVMKDGTVAAWGYNYHGQTTVPAGLVDVVAVAASETHSLALKSDGTVAAWGNNNDGQTTVPEGLGGVVAIAAGPHESLALKSDGSIVTWGGGWVGAVPRTLGDVTAIAAGGEHNLVLRSDGTVAAWGSNQNGQAHVPEGLNGVVAIAAGAYHSLALKSDGTVAAWGFGGQIPDGLDGVVAISAGGYNSLALKSDGTVVGWGYGFGWGSGQNDVPAGLSGVVAIAAGWDHSLALRDDGTVAAWGGINSTLATAVPAGLTGVTAIAVGAYHSLALKSDGTVVAWGDNTHGQIVVPEGLGGVVAITAGLYHNLALKSDGTVVGWGDNSSGQTDVPAGLSRVTAIAAGGKHSMAGALSPSSGLSASGISTTSGGNAGDLTVSIHGTGFEPGAVVKLVQPGQPDIVVTDAIVRSFPSGISVITPTIPLSGAPLGAYSVVVTNPGGPSVTLGEAFSVAQGMPALLGLKVEGPDRLRVDSTGAFRAVVSNLLPIGGNNVDARVVIGDGAGGQLVNQLVTGIAPGLPQVVHFSAQSSQEICKQFAATAQRRIDCDKEKQAFERFSALVKHVADVEATARKTLEAACKEYPNSENCQKLLSYADLWEGQVETLSDWGGKWCAILHFECPNPPDCFPFENFKTDYKPNILPILLERKEVLDEQIRLVAADILEARKAHEGSVAASAGSSASASKQTCWVQSMDPNGKVGTSGCGAERYVSGDTVLPYTVFFENKPTATAPAADVVITDQLDATKVDLDTFTLGAFTFGDRVISPPDGVSDYKTEVDLRPGSNLIVRINAHLNRTTGLVTWRFASIDPDTGLTPTDPMAGFLPPNVTPPEGEGSVSFTIAPRMGLPTGTEIPNQARIVFDTNAPIDTPVWQNTLDTDAPSSEVAGLPAASETAGIGVQWSGADTGSGVKNYTIWVSEDHGPWTVWLRDTSATSGHYVGLSGGTYQFMSSASDNAGNIESWPSKADATIQFLTPTPPVITPTVTGTLGSSGWYTGDASVAWQVTDDESAITSTPGCDSSTVSTDTDGVTLTCQATSAGGTASQSVTVKRDATKPMVVWDAAGPADQASYPSGQVPPAPTCSDAMSGVAECAVTGHSITVGTHTVSVTTTDNAGNTTTEARRYTVTAVNDPPVVQYTVMPLYKLDKANKVGSAVPIKIQVDDAGKNVSNANLTVRAVSLTMGAKTIEPVPDPGKSQPDGNFTFDPTLGDGGGYQFNVKTTGLAPGTWTLNFTIGDEQKPHGTTFIVRK